MANGRTTPSPDGQLGCTTHTPRMAPAARNMGMEHTTPHNKPKLGSPAVVHSTTVELDTAPLGLR